MPELCFCHTCIAQFPARRALLIAERAKLRRLFHLAIADATPAAVASAAPVRTYEETGQILGLHRTTVQQIETKALRKLRRRLQEVAA